MRMLRIFLQIHAATVLIGGVVTLFIVWVSNHPTAPKSWYAGAVEWQGYFWGCLGFVSFVTFCAALGGSSGSAGEFDTDDTDFYSSPVPVTTFGVHPTSGNLMNDGVDCAGNMSGHYTDPFG